MSKVNTTPSTTPSSGARSPEEQFRVVRKRNRVPLSCTPCRTRKKCDRNHPCSNCTKREGLDTSSCSYAARPSRKKVRDQAAKTPDDMQNRIDRLEGLVLTLMNGRPTTDSSTAAAAATVSSRASAPAAAASPTSGSCARVDRDDDNDSDVDDSLATSLGVLKIDTDQGKSMYVGQEHWHTILSDITEVKNFYASHKKELDRSYERLRLSKPATARDGLTFLLGATPASDVELRAALPPKSSVLTLCGRYFSSPDNAVSLIHAPTFHQQLRHHWQDPSRCSIMWLGLLYSVLCLAMLSYHKVGDEPPEWKGRCLELGAEFRRRTVQCLITGDYTKPSEYTVETMILYLVGEHSSRWDADVSLWLIGSTITRLAYRMGYHRDAKWFPTITPFEAEMRRRTWAMIRMADVGFSHQVSLPSMIADHDCDTQLPHNLFDDEFGPDTKVLPPSRPITEQTPISYLIAKAKLYQEMGNVLQATRRIRQEFGYDEILQSDARLRKIKAELPPHLRLQPLHGSHDSPTLIMARFNMDILYQRVMCLIHRNYMFRHARSRRSAVEASLETLRHLATLHRESQGNGRLRSIQTLVTSFITQDFFLPAMLIVLDLHFDLQVEKSDLHAILFWTPEQRSEMIRSLELTRGIWNDFTDTSIEAVKASKVLEVMLAKINSPQPTADDAMVPPAMTRGAKVFGTMAPDSMQPEHSGAISLGMMSSGVAPNGPSGLAMVQSSGETAYETMDLGQSSSNAASGLGADFPSDPFAMNSMGSHFSNMFNLAGRNMDPTSNFDWESIDTFTQNANWVNDQSLFFTGTSDHSWTGPKDAHIYPFGSTGGPL